MQYMVNLIEPHLQSQVETPNKGSWVLDLTSNIISRKRVNLHTTNSPTNKIVWFSNEQKKWNSIQFIILTDLLLKIQTWKFINKRKFNELLIIVFNDKQYLHLVLCFMICWHHSHFLVILLQTKPVFLIFYPLFKYFFQENSRATVLVSLEETNYCEEKGMDPEDPRCTRLMLSGKMKKVNNTTNLKYYLLLCAILKD